MFGPEFLVWVPKAKRFAALLMGSKTHRREAPNLKALLGKAATLTVGVIKTPQYTWQAIRTQPCSTPFELPSPDEAVQVQNTFLNPDDSVEEPEVVEETTTRET